MKTVLIINYTLLIGLFIFYVVYSFKYTFIFKKNTFFIGKKRTFHFIMIWLIPFVWILLLKTLFKPTPGSHAFIDKKDPEKFKDNMESMAIGINNSPLS